MTERPVLVVLAPIAPSATGNGLAMRVDLLVQAAALHHDVHLVVVPVAGAMAAPRPSGRARWETVLAPTAAGDRSSVLEWLADPRWRPLLRTLSPLPDPVAAASPVTTGRRVVEAVAADPAARGRVRGVLAGRLSVAPAAAVAADRLGVPLVVDADDDDEALAASLDDEEGAGAWHRVAAAVLPRARLVLAASPLDAAVLAERHRRPVEVAPNPAPSVRPVPAASPGGRRAVFVGNLTYGPNQAGLAWFVTEVLPRLEGWTVEAVGEADAGLERLLAAAGAPVEVAGAVDDLTPAYERATVAVVPLCHGSGTSIKVLEAMAAGRPVVATSVGARGLEVVAGTHLLVADDPAGFATAVEAAAEPERAGRLVAAGRALVAAAYDAPTVVGAVGARLRAATLAPEEP